MSTPDAVTAIGALADPLRRRLYHYVVDSHDAVSRDDVATALEVPLSTAKFHLDRLVDEGLLTTEFRRLTGRTGPGAGRPSKLYRRSPTDVAASFPTRRYDTVGAILAAAVERSASGIELSDAIAAAAYDRGVRDALRVTATGAASSAGTNASARNTKQVAAESADADAMSDALPRLSRTLDGLGYEPDAVGRDLHLRSCPFDALAREHRDLICGSNEHYVQGVADETAPGCFRATLDPAPNECCVRVTRLDDTGER